MVSREMILGITIAPLLVFCGGRAPLFAVDAAILAEIRLMKERIEALENRVVRQDDVIKAQQALLEEQSAKMEGVKKRVSSVCKHLNFERVKFAEMDRRLPAKEKGKPGLSIEGFEFSGGSTFVFQGTHNANTAGRSKKEARDASTTFDIFTYKNFKDIGGRGFLHLEAGQGDGVENEIIAFSNVNRDVDNNVNVRMTEVWYEQSLLDDKVAILGGKIDPTIYFDNNAFANDETSQFLGRIFRNSPVIGFPPDNTVGVKGSYAPFDFVEVSAGALDGNANWDNLITNDLFSIGQITFKPKLLGREGNYRFLIWNNASGYTRISDAAFNKDHNWGMGICFDQVVWDDIGVFTRFGNQDPRVSIVEYSWSAGLRLEGGMWGRQNDVVGLAIGQLIPGKDYRKADAVRVGKNEGHFEAYYNLKLNDFIAFGPDFQMIWNPYGNDAVEHDTISVYGFRGQVDF